jgi:phosphatidylglycerophosphatase C
VYSLVRLVSPPAPPRAAAVAAFDVDGTLTTRDCVTPFLRLVGGRRVPLALLRHAPSTLGALARRDNDRLKELASLGLQGLPADEVRQAGARFSARLVAEWLRPDTVARLERHRELGHATVLASASFAAYLDPLGETLGVDAVLCTRLEVDDEGLLTGRLEGGNCRGPEKARRVRAWLEETGLADSELWAYGDSDGDRELLAAADRPLWVTRTPLGSSL